MSLYLNNHQISHSCHYLPEMKFTKAYLKHKGTSLKENVQRNPAIYSSVEKCLSLNYSWDRSYKYLLSANKLVLVLVF